jgi:hypothetical protein
MNPAHLHLILTHIPVIGIPLGLCFLAYGFLRGSKGAMRGALFMLVAIAAIAIPTFLTGEPAEEIVEHLPGVAEPIIEQHEDAAVVSLVLTIVTGALAFGALWLGRNERFLRIAMLGTMGAAVAASISLGYTANLGGVIRHSEIRSATTSLNATGAEEKKAERDDD